MTEDNCPIFPIKATDRLACGVITVWLVMARATHVAPEKIASAELVLAAAKEWQQLNAHRVKKAD